MTLYELQMKLGEQIEILTDKNISEAERAKKTQAAMAISSIAKQMINNADVVLRTEKLVAEGKVKGSTIQRMVGKADAQA